MSRRAISKRYHPYSRSSRTQRMRKCSSCKCLKPMSNYKPIILYGKKVIPKTCQQCRSRRNEHYWAYETKKAKEEMLALEEHQQCTVDDEFESLPDNESCVSIELPAIDNTFINNNYHIHATNSSISASPHMKPCIALPSVTYEEANSSTQDYPSQGDSADFSSFGEPATTEPTTVSTTNYNVALPSVPSMPMWTEPQIPIYDYGYDDFRMANGNLYNNGDFSYDGSSGYTTEALPSLYSSTTDAYDTFLL